MSRGSKFRVEWAPYAVEYLGTNKLPSVVTIDKEVGSGGEAVIYTVRKIPNALIKLYRSNDSKELLFREEKVRAMIKAKPQEPTPGHITFAWPLGMVYDRRGRFRGFVMPYIRCAVPISNFFYLDDYSWLERFRGCGVPEDRLNWIRSNIELFRVGVALNLVKAVGYLHAVGHFVGDLNDRNVLVNSDGLVTLIDTDSFFIRDPDTGRIYPSEVGVGEYTAPEVLRGLIPPDRRSESTDVFSLSVIIFKLLMNGYHPFAGTVPSRESNTIEDNIRDCLSPYFGKGRNIVRKPIGAPDINSLPPELTDLFERVFQSCDGSGRPSMEEFLRILENYYKIKRGIHQLGTQRLDLSQFEQCFPSGIAKLREFINKYKGINKLGYNDQQILREIVDIIYFMIRDDINKPVHVSVNAEFVRIAEPIRINESVNEILDVLNMPEDQIPQSLRNLVKSMKQDGVTALPALVIDIGVIQVGRPQPTIINIRKLYEGRLPSPDIVKQRLMNEVITSLQQLPVVHSSSSVLVVMIKFYTVDGKDTTYESVIMDVVTEINRKWGVYKCPDFENLIVELITNTLDELGINRYSITGTVPVPSSLIPSRLWTLTPYYEIVHDIEKITIQIMMKIFPNLLPPPSPPSRPPPLPPPSPPKISLDQQLFDAVIEGDLSKVIDLIRAGANVNAKDAFGRTPLHYTVLGNRLDIVKHLIEHGADVNAKDNNGVTPLHLAAGNGYLDIVKYLIKQKAKINAWDIDGKTPLDYAEEHGHDDVADYLVEVKSQKLLIISMVFSAIFLLIGVGAHALVVFSIFSAILALAFAILALVLRRKWYTVTWLVIVILTTIALVLAYPWVVTLAVILFILYLILLSVYWRFRR